MTGAGGLPAALVVLTLLAGRGGLVRVRAARVRDRVLSDVADAAAPRARSLPGPPRWLVDRLDDAAPPGGPTAAWQAWCGLSLPLVLAATALGGVALAAVVAVAWVVGPLLVVGLRRGAAGRAVEEGLPDALEALARSLRSGAGTHQALAEVAVAAPPGRLGQELRATMRDVAGGVGLELALASLEGRRPEPGVRLAVAALLLGADAGGAHARALDGVAASVRARLGVAREVRALSSQARLSAVVIASAPVAFAVLAAGADSSAATFLLRTRPGLACLAGGLLLDAVGAWWMHRLARVDA